ncbi:MAG: tRNA (N(6)-L-threonylcarbamoyladenosine(37)-C(2))-methylthiotransferase MtaB [Lachnospiraceae bacterium]|nr:tRNA (N(6)-L-threonylcarbamoyladenosine(37)-C(2))-methylthiotransferase MtaB [Lachnospiraceae bacterium]
MGKKAALHNLGCKVNAYETEAMRQLLEEAGYEIVPFAPGADVYVINTCTVTNIADRKSRQMLHKAKKMNPDAIVVAAGCYVETAQNPPEEDSAVDLVLGNNQKGELVEALRMFEETRREDLLEKEDTAELDEIQPEPDKPFMKNNRISDIGHVREYENLSITRTEEHTRAYIKVQDGCNQFCTYCIIPYARGRVRSRRTEDVLREVELLAQSGCREVVLTGIHLSSYGSDLGTSLISLIQAVHAVPGIQRIRLGSLEPGIITSEFAYALRALPKVCPHFHLSLQSGCDSVLKRMNRRYTTAEFEEKCAMLRETFDLPAITTDVIVGFPQETAEEFEETVAFLKRIRLYETHIFKYSMRQGTRAAAMAGQIPESEKGVRSDKLLALGEQNRTWFEEQQIGRPSEVLFEEKMQINGEEYFTGYTKEYIRAAIPASEDYTNQILTGCLKQRIASHVLLFDKI